MGVQVPSPFSDFRVDLGTSDFFICSTNLCRFMDPVGPAIAGWSDALGQGWEIAFIAHVAPEWACLGHSDGGDWAITTRSAVTGSGGWAAHVSLFPISALLIGHFLGLALFDVPLEVRHFSLINFAPLPIVSLPTLGEFENFQREEERHYSC